MEDVKDTIFAIEKDLAILKERVTNYATFTEKSVDVALKAMEARLTILNELRATVSDWNALFLTKAVFDAHVKQITSDIAELKEWRANQTGRASQSSFLVAIAIAILSFIITVVNFVRNL